MKREKGRREREREGLKREKAERERDCGGVEERERAEREIERTGGERERETVEGLKRENGRREIDCGRVEEREQAERNRGWRERKTGEKEGQGTFFWMTLDDRTHERREEERFTPPLSDHCLPLSHDYTAKTHALNFKMAINNNYTIIFKSKKSPNPSHFSPLHPSCPISLSNPTPPHPTPYPHPGLSWSANEPMCKNRLNCLCKSMQLPSGAKG